MIENISNLYKEVEDKSAFLIAAGQEYDRSPDSIKNSWLTGLKRMPEEYQESFHGFLLNWLRQEAARKKERIAQNA